MSAERGSSNEPGEQSYSQGDALIGLGTATGILLAAGPLIEKAAQPVESAEGLATRLGAAVAISIAGTGALHVSSRIRKR